MTANLCAAVDFAASYAFYHADDLAMAVSTKSVVSLIIVETESSWMYPGAARFCPDL